VEDREIEKKIIDETDKGLRMTKGALRRSGDFGPPRSKANNRVEGGESPWGNWQN